MREKRPTTASASTPASPAGPLLKLRDVARILNVGLRTVQTWRASGELPVVMLGTPVRVEPSALAGFLARRRT